MKKEKAKMRAELLKLMQLKKDVLSTQITEYQSAENQFEKKMKFYERVAGEWAAEGEFQQSQDAANGTAPVKMEIAKIRARIEHTQRARLELLVAMRSLSH